MFERLRNLFICLTFHHFHSVSGFGCKIIKPMLTNLSRNKICRMLGNSQNLWGRLENGPGKWTGEKAVWAQESLFPDQPAGSVWTFPRDELLFDEGIHRNSQCPGYQPVALLLPM